MSRPLRIEYEDAYYHVMNRGRNREAIFHGEEYFNTFLDTLAETHERYGIQIHAYCLMTNHYHLLVKTPEANLQRAMRHVGGLYTQRHNRLKKTDGPLFRGRYKAILVDHDQYLLHLSKYIHRNPIEADLVQQLEAYPWSSYPAYIEKGKTEPWLFQQEVYGQLNAKRQLRKKYQAYVNDDREDERLENFYNRKRLEPVLGDEDFIDKITDKLGDVTEEVHYKEQQRLRPSIDKIVEAVSEYYGVSTLEIYQVKKGRGLKNQPRKLAMYLAQTMGGYRLNEIAEAFGLKHYGGVSNAIYMIKQEMETDESLKRALDILYQ